MWRMRAANDIHDHVINRYKLIKLLAAEYKPPCLNCPEWALRYLCMAFSSQGPTTEAAKVIQGIYVHNYNNYYQLFMFQIYGAYVLHVWCWRGCRMFIKLRTLLGNTAHAQMLLPVCLVAHACRCQQYHNIFSPLVVKSIVSLKRHSSVPISLNDIGTHFKVTFLVSVVFTWTISLMVQRLGWMVLGCTHEFLYAACTCMVLDAWGAVNHIIRIWTRWLHYQDQKLTCNWVDFLTLLSAT